MMKKLLIVFAITALTSTFFLTTQNTARAQEVCMFRYNNCTDWAEETQEYQICGELYMQCMGWED